MTPAVVETHALRKRFGAKVAVDELTMSVQRGEVLGFLGPNGAGKTTSLKMLLGLIEPTSGRGTLLGRPLGDRAARARVGFLPEHFRFHEWLTGRELLEFHGRLYGLGGATLARRIDALLERVGLTDAAGQMLRTYSKGMTQRIGLAQALLAEPEVVFLDEPTSGLDPLGRLLVRDVIGELRDAGTAVFLNSHLLGEVEATCDRVVFVKDGRTVAERRLGRDEGALEVELRLDPGTPEVLEGLARFGRDLAQENGLVRLRVDGDESLPEIAAWLVGRGVRLYEMRTARRPLEATFLEIMGGDQPPRVTVRAILTIAQLTLQEAARRRIVLAAVLCGIAFVALFGVGYYFIEREVRDPRERMTLHFIALAGLYVVHFLGVMVAVLVPVDTVSGEVASGVMQTLASKPVRRSEILLGKWLASAILVAGYVLFLATGVLLMARALGGPAPPGVMRGLPLMVLSSLVLMTISIAGGTRLGTIANGITALGLYGLAFIGSWVETVGSIANGNDSTRYVGTVVSLILPSEAMWQLAAHHMQPPIMRDLNLTPFSTASVPSGAMVAWAGLHVAAVLTVALLAFRRRPL